MRSPVAHGRIVGVDLSAARAMPGSSWRGAGLTSRRAAPGSWPVSTRRGSSPRCNPSLRRRRSASSARR
ncbi:hypothetical protein ACFSTI_01880 [Rhizorhabdus histidinilytica]